MSERERERAFFGSMCYSHGRAVATAPTGIFYGSAHPLPPLHAFSIEFSTAACVFHELHGVYWAGFDWGGRYNAIIVVQQAGYEILVGILGVAWREG